MTDIQRLHEQEFEAERLREMEMRFKPDVLDNLRNIEMRLAQIEADSSSVAAAIENIKMHLVTAVQSLRGAATPSLGVPRWSVYTAIVLLVIIAFK